MTDAFGITSPELPDSTDPSVQIGDSSADLPHPRAPLSPEQARLLPFYHDLRNEIVQPDKVVVSTQYFWAKWAPQLGPTLTALVICLRRHCYYNRVTQERRDWCFPEQATLAREIGVESTKTIRAALQHPLAQHFIRREPRYTYDPQRGKKVRTSDMYYVSMDDPLTPDDDQILSVRAAERVLAEETFGRERVARPAQTRPNGQKGAQVRPRPGGGNDRQVPSPTGRSGRQDSAANFAPEIVLLNSTHTTRDSTGFAMATVINAFGQANGTVPTPAQIARLDALCRQFESFARQTDPPTSGADWVFAAIREAVESGSHFVAPRRIARICERWAAQGRPDLMSGVGDQGSGELDSVVEPTSSSREASTSSEPAGGDPVADDPGIAGAEFWSTVPQATSAPPASPPSFVVFPDLDLLSRPLWQTVCDEARRRLPSPVDQTLLAGSQLLAREQDFLIIGINGRSAVQRAELRLGEPLSRVARAVLRRPVELRFVSLDGG